MRKNYAGRKMNNSGATFVAVLLAIAFIAVLGSVAISAAMVNLRMKVIDREAQKTFYSCEEAVDEIYAQLGITSMNTLEKAYQEVMKSVVTSTELTTDTDDPEWEYKTAAKDKELKEKYIDYIKDDNHWMLDDNSGLDKQKFQNSLNDYIGVTAGEKASITSGNVLYNKPYVESVDSFSYVPGENGSYTATNITVKYIQDSSSDEGKYESVITFDVKIKPPSAIIKFVKPSQRNDLVPAMSDYSLIADTGIVADGNNISIDGNVYAGADAATNDSFRATASSTVDFYGDLVVLSNNLTAEQGSSVSTRGATMLWCDNIYAGKDAKQHGSTITLNGKTFVKNDLKINGASSKVNIAGQYSGYSNQGALDADNDMSSAIIVNGPYSDLKLSTSYLYLAGHSYITYGGAGNSVYATGESLSFKGDQEAYLVPPSAINTAAGSIVGNPYVAGSTVLDTTKLNTYLTTEFFAKSLLNPTTPYVAKTVSGKTYLYLNFSSANNAASYMKYILADDAEFYVMCSSLGMSVDQITKAEQQKKYIRSLIELNLKDLKQQSNGGFIAPSGSIISAGAIVKADINVSTVNMGNVALTSTADAAAQVSLDLTNRFTALNNSLDMAAYSTGATGWATGVPTSYTGLSGISVDYNKLKGYKDANGGKASAIVVDPSKITGSSAGVYGTGASPIVIANGTYTHTAGASASGIIVANGDVYMRSDFDGLVIAVGGKIIIENGVRIQSSRDSASIIEDVLKEITADVTKSKNIEEIFRVKATGGLPGSPSPSPTPSGEVSIDAVSFNQLVAFNNWKKTNVN